MKLKSQLKIYLYSWLVVVSSTGLARAQTPTAGATPPTGPVEENNWKNLFQLNNVIKSDQSFNIFVSTYLALLLAFGSLIAFLYLGFNALMMITAAGDEEKFVKAKKGLVAAIIGLIIMITSLTIALATRKLVS